MSPAGAAGDLAPGASSDDFEVRATTAATAADATGTWVVTVSISSKFDAKSRFRPAAPEGTGLGARAYSFQILDAAVADVPVGNPCPAATPANHSAAAGSSQTIVVCGRNRTSGAATTTAAGSSISGTFLTASGTFAGGTVPAASGNVVLARWTGAQITASPGAGLNIVATVGAGASRTSPEMTLDDGCVAPGAGEDCLDNGGYEATGGANADPTANDDTDTTDEDTAKTVDVLANDTDPDAATRSRSSRSTRRARSAR